MSSGKWLSFEFVFVVGVADESICDDGGEELLGLEDTDG
jgi:hypothetical protein